MGVLPEERVIERWRGLAEHRRGFLTERDGPVTVLAPGRRNADHGPDFSDALLATRRGLVAGDIEVHVLSSGWWAHGHAADPAYNRVVLHVVARHDAGRDAALANGRTAPTLVIGEAEDVARAFPKLPDTADWLPCRTSDRSPEEVEKRLDEAGLARFREHATRFATGSDGGPADQVLYAGLLEALGYRRNRAPMARLAAGLPVKIMINAVNVGGGEGLLIGAAGLLPSQRTRRPGGDTEHPRVRRLETAWRQYGGAPLLSEDDWHHARVRPGNYPVRRLAAMARLLVRYRGRGLADGILEKMRETNTPSGLAALVTLPAAGFWREHLDFGAPASGTPPALCGPSRAADLVVNVLLPFAAAWHGHHGDGASRRRVEAVYRDHPALADNAVIEAVRQRLGLPRLRTAVRQQGMLHVARHHCDAGKCQACPLG